MNNRSVRGYLKLAGALVMAVALSGCVIVPAGPRYGYYYHPHPHYYY